MADGPLRALLAFGRDCTALVTAIDWIKENRDRGADLHPPARVLRAPSTLVLARPARRNAVASIQAPLIACAVPFPVPTVRGREQSVLDQMPKELRTVL